AEVSTSLMRRNRNPASVLIQKSTMNTPSSETGQLTQVNGMQMYYEIRGDGEPLVLLHGGTGTGDNWKLVFKDPPEGFRLIAPDLRGHGQSTNPSGEFTFRQSAL